MAVTIYVGYDNRTIQKLSYTPYGQSQRKPLNLADASEVLAQFLFDNGTIAKTYSSITHPGVTIENAQQGLVSYKPVSTDFSDVSRLDQVKTMRWIVKTARYPEGLVFDTPYVNVRIVR